MAYYQQWRAKVDAGEPPKRITWVCGPERLLVEEVVDHVRAALAVSVLDYVAFDLGVDSEREVWAAANQYPAGKDAHGRDLRRLVVVRGAERVARWEPLTGWMDEHRRLPVNYLVLVSAEHDFYRRRADDTRYLPEHLEAMKGRASLVRCTPLPAEDLWAWCQRRTPGITKVDAVWLATRCAGSMVAVRNVLDQAALFTAAPARDTLEAFVSQFAGEAFVDAVVALHRPAALTAAQRVAADELGGLITVLERQLDALAVLHRAVHAGQTVGQVAGEGEVTQYLARKLLPHAKHYDPTRVARCRQLLALADDAFRRGVREAVGEVVIAAW